MAHQRVTSEFPTASDDAAAPPDETGFPGSRGRNWRPGDDDSEDLLLQKLLDALRDGKSEREVAKLLNVPRTLFWHAKKLNAIPQGLFERLLAARVGAKALTYIGRLCEHGVEELPPVEVERCPACGHLLRVRSAGLKRALDVYNKWITDGQPGPSRDDAEVTP
jgi:hypothetical protein